MTLGIVYKNVKTYCNKKYSMLKNYCNKNFFFENCEPNTQEKSLNNERRKCNGK